MSNDSLVIIKELYPLVSAALDKNQKKFINNIAIFMNSRHKELHAEAPYTRILFNKRDADNMFSAIGIDEQTVLSLLKKCYFWNMDIRPQCVKEPYVEVIMCAIIYFCKNKQQKNAELTTIYLCFTGKFYASLHGLFWKYGVKEEIMDYVINNMLTDKYDLKKEGTVFKAIQKLSITYLETYNKKLSAGNISDEGFKNYIQQLRDRVRSFLKNISILYYEAVDNKYYLNYESDSLDPDEFRITSKDAALAARYTSMTVSIFMSQRVDLALCNTCVKSLTTTIKMDELADILEGIFSNRENLPEIRRVVNIIICDFMANPENKGKKVGGVDFIAYSIKAKPNTKSTILIELKQTITKWLNDNSVNYKRRAARRPATANDYYRALLSYIVYTICKVANK